MARNKGPSTCHILLSFLLLLFLKYGMYVNIIHQEFSGREKLENIVLVSK